jgi:trk system potassium uptake protein TrkH
VNLRRVVRILGLILFVIAGAQLPPLAWCLAPLDWDSATGLLAGATSCALLGLALRGMGDDQGELYRREGVLVVVGAWLFASIAGAVPYVVSGAIPGVVDAFFESASGFTTTGASILVNIESLPAPILFWRSMTQWLGGIGIVVLFVALLSELGPGARFLFKLEVPGPKAEILHARVRETAVALFRIYLALTLVQTLLMLVLGSSLYDALTHTFSTVSTGGFSPYTDSVAHFSAAIQIVILIFMLGAGVNFALYAALANRRDASVLRDVELRVYLALVFIASLVVSVDVFASGTSAGPGRVFLDGAFHVVSLLSTTGFATADFAAWPGMAHAVLVGLMFIGGCAGSTAGGAKIIRLLIGGKVAMREVRLTFSPNSVVAIAVGDQVVPEESARGVSALLLLWVLGWGGGALLLSVGDTDIVTAATASLATVSNIGPGLAAVGPTENFAFFADWQKLVMVLLMWLGRLEFFAVLALLLPRFWRR